MRRTQGTFVNARKQTLVTVQYLPTSVKPAARAFFLHGVGEHVGRYTQVFTSLAERGVAVFSFDAHGHGQSEPKAQSERALVLQFGYLVDDLYQYVDVVNTAHPGLAGLPTFVGGVSLGGLAAAQAALRDQGRWAGLFLQSPALDVQWTLALKVQAAMSSVLSALIPKVRMVPAVRPEDMSPDPEDVKAFLDDPNIVHGMLPVRTGAEVLNAFRSLTPRYGEFTLPVYACHGTADRCTSPEATRAFIARVNSAEKVLREVPGGYHELLQSKGWEQHTQPLADWILAHSQEGHPSKL